MTLDDASYVAAIAGALRARFGFPFSAGSYSWRDPSGRMPFG
jgi:hypothetical protein